MHSLVCACVVSKPSKTGFLASWPIYSICHQFRNILFNNSLARILIRCPPLNEHETFFFGVVNMNLCFFVSASQKVTWLGVSGLTLNLISCACKGYTATSEIITLSKRFLKMKTVKTSKFDTRLCLFLPFHYGV